MHTTCKSFTCSYPVVYMYLICTPKFIIGKNCSMGHIGCVWDYGSGDEGGEILEGDE